MGDYEGAAEDYSNAISLNPKYFDAYNNRGNTKNKLKDYQGALEDFDKSIERHYCISLSLPYAG